MGLPPLSCRSLVIKSSNSIGVVHSGFTAGDTQSRSVAIWRIAAISAVILAAGNTRHGRKTVGGEIALGIAATKQPRSNLPHHITTMLEVIGAGAALPSIVVTAGLQCK